MRVENGFIILPQASIRHDSCHSVVYKQQTVRESFRVLILHGICGCFEGIEAHRKLYSNLLLVAEQQRWVLNRGVMRNLLLAAPELGQMKDLAK
jgi:hypothetical protein